MSYVRKLAIGTAAVMLVAGATAAAAADVAKGKALVQKHCTACHGTEVYSRPNHRMKSLEMLRNQLGRCQQAAGVKLTKQEAADIVAYLNQTFYKFKQ